MGNQEWQCIVCGFVYDEAAGVPEEGITFGMPWGEIRDERVCPDCGAGKGDFESLPAG